MWFLFACIKNSINFRILKSKNRAKNYPLFLIHIFKYRIRKHIILTQNCYFSNEKGSYIAIL